jgi:hypothetical protein
VSLCLTIDASEPFETRHVPAKLSVDGRDISLNNFTAGLSVIGMQMIDKNVSILRRKAYIFLG